MAEQKPTVVSAEEMKRQRELTQLFKGMQNRPKTYHVVTFGCQMNAHDSEHIAGMLRDMGMTESVERDNADFVIFNTCCVRDNAQRRALGNVSWLKNVQKNKPDLMIAVCGCMVQQPGMVEKIMKQYRFIDLAFGTTNLYKLPELMIDAMNRKRTLIAVDDHDVVPEDMPVKRLRKEAAYITIMYGCNNFCSYCIVPHVRGRERSREMEAIIREAVQLKEDGVKEIMLLGQNVNSYGKGLDGAVSFAKLLRELDKIGIPRIRFMTSHPKDLSDELIEVMANAQNILPQFHLPVQSGNDEILRLMNRHYTREQYMNRVKALRQAIPGISLTTDLIVGFPGETQKQFEDTLSIVEEVGFDSAFTFIYSPREGTSAAQMPDQIAPEISSERIGRLIKLQESCQKQTMKRFIGKQASVLVEGMSKRSENAVSGKSEHGLSVAFEGSIQDVGEIVRVRITDVKSNTLIGERI